jgi:hypothetical protein
VLGLPRFLVCAFLAEGHHHLPHAADAFSGAVWCVRFWPKAIITVAWGIAPGLGMFMSFLWPKAIITQVV